METQTYTLEEAGRLAFGIFWNESPRTMKNIATLIYAMTVTLPKHYCEILSVGFVIIHTNKYFPFVGFFLPNRIFMESGRLLVAALRKTRKHEHLGHKTSRNRSEVATRSVALKTAAPLGGP